MTLASVGDSGSCLFQESLDALLWLDEKLKQSVIVDLPGILKPLIEKLKYPIVSAAVLTWLRSDLSVFEKNISTGIMSAHFLVLEEIAHAQKDQIGLVFDFLIGIFEKSFADLAVLVSIEFKKVVIDRLMFLVQCDFVLPILEYFVEKGPSLDESLIVYFLMQLNERIDLTVKIESESAVVCLKTLISGLSEATSQKLRISTPHFFDIY